MRQKKREVKIGNVTIGGSNPIAVQTMLNVPVEDIEGNVAQAKRCEAAGCQILRVTCPSPADAKCIEAVKNAVNIPIVADIHFDYKAALACADVGVDKIRINPGNIGDDDRVKAVVDACQQKNIDTRNTQTITYKWNLFLPGFVFLCDDSKIVFHRRCNEECISRGLHLLEVNKLRVRCYDFFYIFLHFIVNG